MLPARHDDDDYYIYIYIYISANTVLQALRECESIALELDA